MTATESAGDDEGPDLTRRDLLAVAVAAPALAWPSLAPAQGAAPDAASALREARLDAGWRFLRGDAPGAEVSGFDDGAWRILDLPHDWSVEDLPGAPRRPDPWRASPERWSLTARRAPDVANGEYLVTPVVPPPAPGGPPRRVGPFDPEASQGGWSTGWLVGGTGWYRKAFDLAPAPGEVVELRFDGAYIVTDAWLNGAHLGTHDHGHNPFAFDLTPHLAADGRNLLAVRVRNEGFTSRWYNGSGLYRHAWLTRTGAVRVPRDGVYVRAPDATPEAATVLARVEVENRGAAEVEVEVEVALRGPDGAVVGREGARVAVPAGATEAVELSLVLSAPSLWRPGEGGMHGAEVVLLVGGAPVDRVDQPFGIRSIACDARTGLRINGEPVKLRGAAVHADNGLLGCAAHDAAEARKVALLKAQGFNAVRASHNLFAPAFLDACDREGMIVVEETFDVWNEGKFGQDLGAARFKARWQGDVEAMVRRDRSRPSIVFWQIGNEIPERDTPLGVETATRLRDAIRALDPTRLLTAALTIGSEGAAGEPSRRGLDVVGYNYLTAQFEADHAAYPDLVFMATEDYARDSYASWALVERHPWMIGTFCWTAIDFLGEVGVGASQLRRDGEGPPQGALPFQLYLWDYPAYVAGCGEMDLLGHKRPPSFWRDVLWGRSPVEVFVQRPTPPGFHEEVTEWGWSDELASWTWPGSEGVPMTVRAYAGGDEVVLLLDGREVGRRRLTAADELRAEFRVPYAPGTLTAVALRGGVEVGRRSLVTVEAPAALRLTREAGPPGALAWVMAEVVDAEGRRVPDAQADLAFAVDGAARLLAAGAANPRGIESLSDGACTTYQGVAQAVVASAEGAGAARLNVSSPGLAGATLDLTFG